MKILTAVFLFIVLTAGQISAQDSIATSLKKSAFALQFLISSDFTLRSFSGSTLSAKYHIYDMTAFRFGLGISANTDTYRKVNNVETDKEKYFNFSLTAQLVHYLPASTDISLYFGAGPYYSRNFSKSLPGNLGNNNWQAGLSGNIGAEWFFKNNMSLCGEYGLLIYYYVDKRIDQFNNQYIKSFNINADQVKLGLSVYL